MLRKTNSWEKCWSNWLDNFIAVCPFSPFHISFTGSSSTYRAVVVVFISYSLTHPMAMICQQWLKIEIKSCISTTDNRPTASTYTSVSLRNNFSLSSRFFRFFSFLLVAILFYSIHILCVFVFIHFALCVFASIPCDWMNVSFCIFLCSKRVKQWLFDICVARCASKAMPEKKKLMPSISANGKSKRFHCRRTHTYTHMLFPYVRWTEWNGMEWIVECTES